MAGGGGLQPPAQPRDIGSSGRQVHRCSQFCLWLLRESKTQPQDWCWILGSCQCHTTQPSSAWEHAASSDIYRGTWPLLVDSHKLWEQAGEEHPLPSMRSSSCDADLGKPEPCWGSCSHRRILFPHHDLGDPSPPSLQSGTVRSWST